MFRRLIQYFKLAPPPTRSVGQLVDDITRAIFRQEGMSSVYTNPGNLRGAPWLTNPTIVGGFWRPATRQMGVCGAGHVVLLHIAEGQTLRQLIDVWAPESDGNNTAEYVANVSTWANIPDIDQPLWNLVQG